MDSFDGLPSYCLQIRWPPASTEDTLWHCRQTAATQSRNASKLCNQRLPWIEISTLWCYHTTKENSSRWVHYISQTIVRIMRVPNSSLYIGKLSVLRDLPQAYWKKNSYLQPLINWMHFAVCYSILSLVGTSATFFQMIGAGWNDVAMNISKFSYQPLLLTSIHVQDRQESQQK